MKINMALAEDNLVNRNTFHQKISGLPQFNLVFVARNGQDCLDQLQEIPENQLPVIVFMDIEMPILNGIETIQIGKTLYPQIHFIVLTVFDDEEKIFEAIRAGASGYLLKHETAQVLLDAVTNVLESGGAPMSPAIARKTLQLLSKATPEKDSVNSPVPKILTEREQEILAHLVSGWDAKRISATLHLSVLTVRKHIANLYAKLHVTSKAQVISMAHQQRWFQ